MQRGFTVLVGHPVRTKPVQVMRQGKHDQLEPKSCKNQNEKRSKMCILWGFGGDFRGLLRGPGRAFG
jgi:hypothetical protein